MKKIISVTLIIFLISCKKVVEKNTETLVGIYTSVDANLFHKAFDSKHQERWFKSTLILNKDSTYIFETEQVLSKGDWRIVGDGNIKFTCLFDIEKFDGNVYNPRIIECKTEIPILLFQDDEILYEDRKDQFEYVTKYPERLRPNR